MRRFNFEFDVFSKEVIAEMTNDELKLHISQFRRMIKEARNQGKDTLVFETEFCYLDHEHQHRQRAERIGRKNSKDNSTLQHERNYNTQDDHHSYSTEGNDQ